MQCPAYSKVGFAHNPLSVLTAVSYYRYHHPWGLKVPFRLAAGKQQSGILADETYQPITRYLDKNSCKRFIIIRTIPNTPQRKLAFCIFIPATKCSVLILLSFLPINQFITEPTMMLIPAGRPRYSALNPNRSSPGIKIRSTGAKTKTILSQPKPL